MNINIYKHIEQTMEGKELMEKLTSDLKDKLIVKVDCKKSCHKNSLSKTDNTHKSGLTDKLFWDKVLENECHMNHPKQKIEYLLNEFGTREPCNRFDVGNVIEFILCDYIKSIGFEVEELPNAKRIDLCINNGYKLSIKFSSTGDITLHNSNSCINKDEYMTDLILLTTSKLYLITNEELAKHSISIKEYIKNAGDSLKLKRSILKELERKEYPYIVDFKLNVDKSKCKNRLCSKVFYKAFNDEYELINIG